MTKKSNHNGKNLLLDTNILDYSLKKETGEVFHEFLDVLKKAKYLLTVSQYTRYEISRGANIKKEITAIDTYNKYGNYAVTQNVLETAAMLENLYKSVKIQADKISDGDKIIAATAIIENLTILTANGRDFPWPIFKECNKKIIIFKVKNRSRCLFITYLKPDYEVIVSLSSQRM